MSKEYSITPQPQPASPVRFLTADDAFLRALVDADAQAQGFIDQATPDLKGLVDMDAKMLGLEVPGVITRPEPKVEPADVAPPVLVEPPVSEPPPSPRPAVMGGAFPMAPVVEGSGEGVAKTASTFISQLYQSGPKHLVDAIHSAYESLKDPVVVEKLKENPVAFAHKQIGDALAEIASPDNIAKTGESVVNFLPETAIAFVKNPAKQIMEDPLGTLFLGAALFSFGKAGGKIGAKALYRESVKEYVRRAKEYGVPGVIMEKFETMMSGVTPESFTKEVKRYWKVKTADYPSRPGAPGQGGPSPQASQGQATPPPGGLPSPGPQRPQPPPRPAGRGVVQTQVPIADVKPNPDGGWTFTFNFPKGVQQIPEPSGPAIILPQPVRDLLPAPIVEAIDKGTFKPRTGGGKKGYSDPLIQAIARQGGIKPSPDYPTIISDAVLPPGIVTKNGMGIDEMASVLTEEFPEIDGYSQNLVDLLEKRKTMKFAGKALTDAEGAKAEAAAIEQQYEEELINAWEEGRWPESRMSSLDRDILASHMKQYPDAKFGMRAPKAEAEPEYPPDWDEAPAGEAKEQRPLFGGEFAPLAEKAAPEPQPKAEQGELFETPKPERSEFDKLGLSKFGDINSWIEKAQPLVEKGYVIEYGHTGGTDGWARVVEVKKPGEGRLISKAKAPDLAKAARQERLPEASDFETPPEKAKPTITEIQAIFDKKGIPVRYHGDLRDHVLTKYDPANPKHKSLEEFITATYARFMTPEGEMKNAVRQPVKAHAKIAASEEATESPEKGFEEARSEQRIREAIKRHAKDKIDEEIMEARLWSQPFPEDYRSIGKRLGIAHETVRKREKRIFAALVDDPDLPEIRELIRNRMIEAKTGPVPTARDIERLAKWFKRYFTTGRGLVSKEIDHANDERIGKATAEIFGGTLEADKLLKFIEKNDAPGLRAYFLEALKGDVDIDLAALPDDIKRVIHNMRSRIDNLSDLVVTYGALPEAVERAFLNNMGKYLTRQYRLHHDKAWVPPADVRQRFVDYLKSKWPGVFGQFTPEEMDNYLKSLLEGKPFFYQPPTRAFKKRIPTDLMKERKDLPKEFREFAGEIVDPVWLYAYTIVKQATMAYNAEFLSAFKDAYGDLMTSDKVEAWKRGDKYYQFPDTPAYGPIRNLYAHPDVWEYITQEVIPGMDAMNDWFVRNIVNPFKVNRTIFSVPTHARNLMGNMMFSLLGRNFILNPLNAPYYFDALDIIANRKGKRQADWEDLIKRGVTEVQFYGAEVHKRLYGDLLRLEPLRWPDKIWETVAKLPAEKVEDFFGGLYTFEDVLYRIASDLKNRKHFKLDPQESAIEVNRTFQNYRKMPAAVDFLRKYPLLGPFISFHANVAKILGVNIKEGLSAVAKGGPEPEAGEGAARSWGRGSGPGWGRARGAARLATVALILALPTIASKISREFADVSDEEDEGIRRFQPKWRKNGTFIYWRNKEGKLHAVDLTYIWPVSEMPMRIIKTIASGAKGEAELNEVLESLNFLENPLFDMVSIIAKGQDPNYGMEYPKTGSLLGDMGKRLLEGAKYVYLPQSVPIPDLEKLLGSGEIKGGALTTSQIQSLIDAWNQTPDSYGKTKEMSHELVAFFSGIRSWEVDFKDQVSRYLMGEKYLVDKEFDKLTSWRRRHADASAEDVAREMTRYKDYYSKHAKNMRAARDFLKMMKEKEH